MKTLVQVPFPLLLCLCLLASCSAARVDLPGWRAEHERPRPEEARSPIEQDFAAVERLREQRRLAEARDLALVLAAEQPLSGEALHLASRAESDGVLLFAQREKAVRNAAAASALDYARRARELGFDGAAARGQHAYALGSAVHLAAMTDRSAQAHATLQMAESALALDPEEPTALATLALVHLRLETLPWIARVMSASSRPRSSLEQAVDFARRAVAARPSREHHLILARCLRASGDREGARAALDRAIGAPPTDPRDDVLLDLLKSERAR